MAIFGARMVGVGRRNVVRATSLCNSCQNRFVEKFLRKLLPDGTFSGVCPIRSVAMSKVKSKGNRSTENRLRFALVRKAINGWTLHAKHVLGTPDFYFEVEKLAIFVDGCFWHGCSACGHIPKTRSEFWAAKIARNRKRRIKVKRQLKKNGVTVLRFWEHELRSNLDDVLDEIQCELHATNKRHASRDSHLFRT